MLWGHTLRSPHAHARIEGIDVSAALAASGVHAVLTHADVPGQKTYGLEFPDQPVLAIDRVRYHGEPVAVVAAESPEQARRAADLISVDYEPLELVVDLERATEQEPLHPDRPTAGHGHRDDPRPNVVRSIVISRGDPDAEAAVSVSGVYELASQDQAFLGTESGLAVPDGEGGRGHLRRHPVAARRPRADRSLPGPPAGAGSHPPRRRRWRVRRAGGPLHPDPRGIARLAHGAAREDGVRPGGVVRGSRASAPREDLGRAPRHCGGPPRRREHAHPSRRRRLRIELDGGARQRLLLRRGSVSRRQRPHRRHVRVHEQSPVRSDARLRLRPGLLRTRGADGQAGGRARHRRRRATAAQCDRAGRRPADRAGRHRLTARGRGHPALLRAHTAAARGAAPRLAPAAGRHRQHDAGRGCQSRDRLRGRLQEHLLLGGLRRLLHGARAPLRAPPRRPRCRGVVRGSRGRAGRDRRHRSGCPHGARDRRRHRRRANDVRRRLVRLDVGVANDVDGRRSGPARLPRRARRVARIGMAKSTSSVCTATHRRPRSTPRPARCSASGRTWRLPARR